MTFAYPLLLLSPLVFIVLRWARAPKDESAPFPSSLFLAELPRSFRQRIRGPLITLLALATVTGLSVAAARPQRVTVIDQNRASRNIILVIDASNSMSARDFPTSFGFTSRMEGVKSVVAEYVRARSQDRIGLVVFGNTGYLQSPLTSDTALVEELVKYLYPRMAGDGTAIGDGLGLALKRLREVKDGTKAIILMTDGVNTAGQVSPLKAAQVAKDMGVQIHAIGIGTGTSPAAQQPLGGILGIPVGPMAEIDEGTLRSIAETTGGAYFNANNLDDFKEVYRKIEKLTETEESQPAKTLVEELFPPFVGIALGCYLLLVTLTSTILSKVP